METREIIAVDVWSLGRTLGAIALIWGVIVAIVALAAGVVGGTGPFPGGPELFVGVAVSVLGGIAAGVVTAILYNAAAALLGGIEVELA
jgi:hypothetical protein